MGFLGKILWTPYRGYRNRTLVWNGFKWKIVIQFNYYVTYNPKVQGQVSVSPLVPS